MSNIAKISIKKHNSNEEFLYDLDKSLPLSEIMNDICLKSALVSNAWFYNRKLIYTQKFDSISVDYLCSRFLRFFICCANSLCAVVNVMLPPRTEKNVPVCLDRCFNDKYTN